MVIVQVWTLIDEKYLNAALFLRVPSLTRELMLERWGCCIIYNDISGQDWKTTKPNDYSNQSSIVGMLLLQRTDGRDGRRACQWCYGLRDHYYQQNRVCQLKC